MLPPVQALLCEHGRCAWYPKSVRTGGEDVQFPVVSWGTGIWHPAAWAEASSKEEIELLRSGGAMGRLASRVGLYTWSWQGGNSPGSWGHDHGGMGSWCPKVPSPDDTSL